MTNINQLSNEIGGFNKPTKSPFSMEPQEVTDKVFQQLDNKKYPAKWVFVFNLYNNTVLEPKRYKFGYMNNQPDNSIMLITPKCQIVEAIDQGYLIFDSNWTLKTKVDKNLFWKSVDTRQDFEIILATYKEELK